jgi:NADH:ubiquinone oxidoreductase subunit 2 (subunit N)
LGNHHDVQRDRYEEQDCDPQYGGVGAGAAADRQLCGYDGLSPGNIEVHKMLYFDTFGLLGNSIAFASTLLLVLLSGPDMEKVGHNLAEYFALIFFVLCGVSLVTTFNTLLMLFLGIEIISIPLYI